MVCATVEIRDDGSVSEYFDMRNTDAEACARGSSEDERGEPVPIRKYRPSDALPSNSLAPGHHWDSDGTLVY